ncbi:hypothetical protein BLNAU_1317 [Blattamonas nauphoetae]|uniref:Uncharacterized protein n=1 Tax=Blattamonas nauphoetae TaxID=2049346 RepID=A0ABQ9YJ39_9EUKA|nr:hypothetical protein BLNAU_1317 [Blattamonas nauphoetae]
MVPDPPLYALDGATNQTRTGQDLGSFHADCLQKNDNYDERIENLERNMEEMRAEIGGNEKRRELERKIAELQAEREANQELIKEGLERRKEKKKEEEERKRQSRVGAAAIELFPPSKYSLSGSTFTAEGSGGGDRNLVSVEFGAVVARLSLVVGSEPQWNYMIGIICSGLTASTHSRAFVNLKGAGAWDLFDSHRMTWLNAKYTNQYQACLAGRAGQRVVVEADGREGRRTLRMSQDGQTQPAFFTNIPVPFRFAVCIFKQNDSVTIESVEVVEEPLLVGGTIAVQM